MQHINVGCVGAGLSATTFHAPFIVSHPSLRLTKFLRSSGATPVPGFESLPVCTDLQDFLAGPPAVDLVVITTPTHTHYSIAKACLEAGKHVVLEKPMCPTAAEASELCSIARAADKLLAVYQNRRWDGDFMTAAALVKAGALGRVVEFESHFDRFRNSVKPGWKEDGQLPGAGILHDLGSHLVDQTLTLFGRPTALTAHILNQRQLPATTVPDAFTLLLHYESSAGPLTALLRASMLTKTPGPRFAIHGTLGSYTKSGMDVQEGQLRAGMSPLEPGFGVEAPGSRGLLDSVALDLQTLGATSGLPGQEASTAAGGGTGSGPAARLLAEAAGAGGVGSAAAGACDVAALNSPEVARVLGLPAADAATIAAAVLARKDASNTSGSSSGSGDARVRVVTETGRWMEFYNDVARVLLGEAAQQPAVAAAAGPHGMAPSSAAAAATGPVEAAAAVDRAVGGGSGVATGKDSSSSSSAGGLNSRLAVQPEQAAAVIELLELAMQSSRERRTVSVASE